MSEKQLKRRIQATLEIEADDMNELASALIDLGRQLDIDWHKAEPHAGWRSISGGYASGHVLTIDVDPEMDGDKYRAWLSENYGPDRKE